MDSSGRGDLLRILLLLRSVEIHQDIAWSHEELKERFYSAIEGIEKLLEKATNRAAKSKAAQP